MPFVNMEQEMFLMIQKPSLWRKWTKLYGSTVKHNILLKNRNRKKHKKKR